MSKRARILTAATAAILAAGAAMAWWTLSNDGATDGRLEASGTVEGTEADLGFQLPGRVARVGPREGDRVSEGDELAVLGLAQLEAGRAAAAARLQAAQARLRELETGSRAEEIRSAEAALDAATEREEEARREAERARRLFEGGAISRQALDRTETGLRVANAHRRQAAEQLQIAREGPRREAVEAQRALVEQARADLARADAALDDARIVAPFSGVVTVRHREPGEVVQPGAPVLTLLDRDDRWVRIYVAEDAIGRVSLGQPASIRSDTYPDRTYAGEVFFVGSKAEFTPRNVQTPEERTQLVYPVKVRITGDEGFELKPGIPADVALGVEGGAP